MPKYTTKNEPVDKKPYIVYNEDKGIVYSGDPDADIPSGGGGDSFITTKVTFINNTDNFNTVFLPNIMDIPDNQLIVGIHYAAQGTTEANVPLVGLGANLIFSDISGISITVSGDIEGEDEEYIITGECTITISDS